MVLFCFEVPLTRHSATLVSTSPTRGEVINTSVYLTSPLVGEVTDELCEEVGEGLQKLR